jgi:hypothetical protein
MKINSAADRKNFPSPFKNWFGQKLPNSFQQLYILLFGKLMLPNPKHAPVGRPQPPVHQPVAGLVRGQFSMPERPIVFRFGFMFWAGVPEAAVNENGEPHLPENKIWADAKGRARHSVRAALGILPDGAQRTACPTTNFQMPPPAGDFAPTK